MSKITTIIFTVTLLFIQNVFADTVIPSDRVQSSLRVRADTSLSSTIIGRLYPGDSAQYLDSVLHWYHVQLSGGTQGYVYKEWSELLTSSQGELQVHFIDAGQGDSTLIICPGGESILVDAGSSAHGDVDLVRDYIVNLLDQHERRINNLVITHADTEHYSFIPDIAHGKFIPDIAHSVRIDRVFSVGVVQDYTASFAEWLDRYPDSKETILQPDYYDREGVPNPDIDCGSAEVYILAAALRSSFSRKNTMSITMMIRHGNFKVLLTGDATKITERTIIDRYDDNWLNVDLLKVGNHGSETTSTIQAWVDVVRPEVAVISAGYRSHDGHPRKEVVERLDDYTTNTQSHRISYASKGKGRKYIWEDVDEYTESIYLTNTNGNIVITSDGNGYSVNTSFHEE